MYMEWRRQKSVKSRPLDLLISATNNHAHTKHSYSAAHSVLCSLNFNLDCIQQRSVKSHI